MADGSSLFEALCHRALASGRGTLSEPELYRVLGAMGFEVPRHEVLERTATRTSLSGLVVLKIVSPDVLHKSDVGGVQMVEARSVTQQVIADLIAKVSETWGARHGRAPAIEGVLAVERVSFDRTQLASEIIAGVHRTPDFGLVGMIGFGGLKAELLGNRLPRREAVAIFDPRDPASAFRELQATLLYRDLSGQLRGSTRALSDDAWRALLSFLEVVARSADVARSFTLEELEFNPLVVRDGALVPLDALARLSPPRLEALRSPVDKLRKLFEPRSVAVAGVSSKSVNMGRVIVRNLLRDGFAPEQLTIIKPGDSSIDGVRCVADVAALNPVDLAVLAVSAESATETLEHLVRRRAAEAVIVIPGGMAEKAGGKAAQDRLEGALAEARSTEWRGPVVIGPNSMGVRSIPGRLDTTFIPPHKLPARTGPLRNVAFLSQSGAFTITQESRLTQLVPRYLVSAGNQADVGLSELAAYVLEDPEVKVVALYVEGFKPGDGRQLLTVARRAQALRKRMILYKGGRTTEGQGAAAGHTAAIASDYRAGWHLLTSAGVLLAESFTAFEGLVRVCGALAGRARGQRTMLMSNAGFEVVGMADHLRGETSLLRLCQLSASTQSAMATVLRQAKLEALVDVKNPMDVTPSASDATYLALARAALLDEAVDALVVGVVPMSPALATLERAETEAETIASKTSLATTLPLLFTQSSKPLVVVVDAGALYDPFVQALERTGLPVFRRADEAIQSLREWVNAP